VVPEQGAPAADPAQSVVRDPDGRTRSITGDLFGEPANLV
jgi:hypothetical protein